MFAHMRSDWGCQSASSQYFSTASASDLDRAILRIQCEKDTAREKESIIFPPMATIVGQPATGKSFVT